MRSRETKLPHLSHCSNSGASDTAVEHVGFGMGTCMLSATITTVLLLSFGTTGMVFGAAGLGFGFIAAVGPTTGMVFGTAGLGSGSTAAVGFSTALAN